MIVETPSARCIRYKLDDRRQLNDIRKGKASWRNPDLIKKIHKRNTSRDMSAKPLSINGKTLKIQAVAE